MNDKRIYVIAEVTSDKKPSSLTLELIGLAESVLAERNRNLSVILLGSGIANAAEELAGYGADVIAVDHEMLRDYNPDTYLLLLVDLLKANNSAIILAGHTSMGQDLLPRLAFSLNAGLVTDCVGIEAEKDGGDLYFRRYVYGGNALATQKVTTDTAMATVRPRVGGDPSSSGKIGEITYPEVQITGDTAIKIIDKKISQRELDLEDAPVVVSGGRGMGGEKGFEKLWELASLLNGTVGASRPPVDSGWINPTRQVGITGKVVAPDIYIAVAISGSTQHLSGISETGVVIAINKDGRAYIFKTSDYGVVGDWQKVLPAFTEELKKLIKE